MARRFSLYDAVKRITLGNTDDVDFASLLLRSFDGILFPLVAFNIWVSFLHL